MAYTFTKSDINEATPLIQRLLKNLSSTISDKGVVGSTARTAIGDTYANAAMWMGDGTIGVQLDHCFDLCRQTGATVQQFEVVRQALDAESPLTLGATLVKDYAIQIVLAHEGKIISQMTFSSRQDVNILLDSIKQPFADAEEIAADTMDAMTFRGLVELQAAVVNFLVTASLPLPELLQYQFNAPLPSLVISQRLYYDASRYDEIRNENKIVHPAFCPSIGLALSF